MRLLPDTLRSPLVLRCLVFYSSIAPGLHLLPTSPLLAFRRHPPSSGSARPSMTQPHIHGTLVFYTHLYLSRTLPHLNPLILRPSSSGSPPLRFMCPFSAYPIILRATLIFPSLSGNHRSLHLTTRILVSICQGDQGRRR